jgi:nitroreductase
LTIPKVRSILGHVDLYEVMRVTGQVRAFRPDPVPDAAVYRALDHARFAPNGGNRQGWRVIVVKDGDRRRALRDLYLRHYRAYRAKPAAGSAPAAPERGVEQRRELAERLDQVPVHLLVLVDLGALAVVDAELPRQSIVGGGSIYPFVQNILLSLRNEGLAAALTTLIVRSEPELKELLEIPEQYAVAALILVGRPRDPLPTRLSRKPVEDFATVDSFSGPAFGDPLGRSP